ncbi:FRG domain-containing protein [Microbacterium sp. cx-55]|uniref:FRG domain-containing protein n=1 Tax=Microbacterium sp. cx-55 TaxID=2875948 RepID=UPI001CBD4E1F|nr:FRG domain-containing protein [Microbacterium sp. cx-55]MBZ4488077.1 FRG domain-containing protein [Microbacterium sp. cx-55]UGB34517.1 FRG domain-containing protein [Microbacterium sp. cx-55]
MRDVEDADVEAPFPVYSVTDPTALIQVIGWLKSTSPSPTVFFRGQAGLYRGRLAPSGLRNRTDVVGPKGVATHDRQLRDYIDQLWGGPCTCTPSGYKFSEGHLCKERHVGGASAALYRGVRRASVEPLLQHYGIRTRWVDLVDNAWVALWFACHEYVMTDGGNFAYLRPRLLTSAASAYIVVVDIGPTEPTAIPGYWLADTVRLIDLRYAVPSIYVRPHAQHGLLVAPRGGLGGEAPMAVERTVRAAIQIDLALAREWLGTGAMVTDYVLFPPAVRDEGYRRLLRHAPRPAPTLGALTHIGPGR